MLNRLKNYFWIALAIGAFYFLLSHHIVFTSVRDLDLLKKTELTLEYTFYNLKSHSVGDTLRIDMLRDAGIEDILLDRGLVTEEKLDQLLDQIDAQKAKEEGA